MENLPLFLTDAIKDSVKLLPSLFFIFIFIELFESFFAHKVPVLISFSKKLGPLLGALLAIIPQCGFSVIMTTLFIKRYITIGTLISVYIATSDEAVPILLSNPDKFNVVINIILIKLVLAIVVGYLIDLILKLKLHDCSEKAPCSHLKAVEFDKGCCKHKIDENKIKNIILHPIKHTIVIFLFILISCIILNYFMQGINEQLFVNFATYHKIAASFIFALFGLIPNCAVSVLVSMMYLKGILSFSLTLASLCSNAGLGLIVLITKEKNIKNIFIIISLLILSAFIIGIMF